MITSIDKLENLGIYTTIPPKKASDFKRYNLIYGWNGSGKSTLSRLFNLIGGGTLPKEYEGFKATVSLGNASYNEIQFPIATESISVFNEDFVRDNIDWNGTLKSILLLDEKNIEETKKYNSLKTKLYGNDGQPGLIKEHENSKAALEKENTELQKILTNIGKSVKTSFVLLDTGDSYYMNYDKRKVQALLENPNIPLSDDDLLNADELNRALNEAKPIKKDTITGEVAPLDNVSLLFLANKTKELLSRKIAAKVIEDLRNNQHISTWVKEGLDLHKKEKRSVCAFCGSIIGEERFKDLDAHFSDALNTLNNDIDACIDEWESHKCDSQKAFTNLSVYYDELVQDVKTTNEEYAKRILNFNAEIEKYTLLLTLKRENPFDTINFSLVEDSLYESVVDLNEVLKKYEIAIETHNAKTAIFDESIKEAKKKVERHYVRELIIDLNYDSKARTYKENEEDLNKESTTLLRLKESFDSLEAQLSNETLGAEEFNLKLEQFLGYNEIKIKFDKENKGYRIYRNEHEEASNLSEGEKTAIAFIYFITKLKENGKRIEDSIIVIDDPISSFDSNKLFAAYAYMKSECEHAKQMFVLTHNYNYFSLVLGWFCKKHCKDKETGDRVPDYAVYRIENKIENAKRVAVLSDGGETLKQATEYDYVFHTVYSLRDRVLTKQESIFCGNICRKLVESFLSFKFPKQRADLAALLHAALPRKEDIIKRERIYKFVNIYSHQKKINVFEELDTDILDANEQMVINDILSMIEKLDANHYQAMVEKVQSEPFA
ncbi:MAG: AAA family ATPase [Ruminiclostridium sp.]|nr:AAA family ATPase [Ruminiclostridium sp.]